MKFGVPLPTTGRYLLLMYDDGTPGSEDPPAGEVAFTIYTPIGGISPLLIYDPVTNTVTLSGVTVPTPTITPFGTPLFQLAAFRMSCAAAICAGLRPEKPSSGLAG